MFQKLTQAFSFKGGCHPQIYWLELLSIRISAVSFMVYAKYLLSDLDYPQLSQRSSCLNEQRCYFFIMISVLAPANSRM